MKLKIKLLFKIFLAIKLILYNILMIIKVVLYNILMTTKLVLYNILNCNIISIIHNTLYLISIYYM